MEPSDDRPIWYASYGSNCLAARFLAYLNGGQATGTSRSEQGARDPRPARDSAPFWFPTGVRFVGESKKWGGGGVAFLDHRGGAPAPGRRYLISRGQFEDIAAQESGRVSTPLPVDDLVVGTVQGIGTGWYDGLLALPEIDGVPVVTFTSPVPLGHRPVAPPSAAYLGTLLRGLKEVHPRPTLDLADCLMRAPGVAAAWDVDQITALTKK